MAEAHEMNGSLASLIKNFDKSMQHEHVNDSTYEREVTLALYDEDKLERFGKASIELIKNTE